MATLDWTTFSRLEATSIDNVETTRSLARTVGPTALHTQVDDIDAQSAVPSSAPITLSNLHLRLQEAVEWQAVSGHQAWDVYSRFELRCTFEEVAVVVVSRDANGEEVQSEEYAITGEIGGPWPLSVAQQMLQDAHARVVLAKGLT